jgi:hypothetical protein
MIARFKPKSISWHPLCRFVTKEAIARRLKVPVKHIYRVRLWFRVILVVGKGISRFVSYADLPPILGVDLPQGRDYDYWRRRWSEKYAPDFWIEFYQQHFQQATSMGQLFAWGKLVGSIKHLLIPEGLETLRSLYRQKKDLFQTGKHHRVTETISFSK